MDELFDMCVKTLAENSISNQKAEKGGIISNNEACISIIHNFLKANILDENRRNNLKSVLFQYAIEELSTNGIFSDYKHDNKCPNMTIEDYIMTTITHHFTKFKLFLCVLNWNSQNFDSIKESFDVFIKFELFTIK